MGNEIDPRIAAQEAKIENLLRQVDLEKAVLTGMRMMAGEPLRAEARLVRAAQLLDQRGRHIPTVADAATAAPSRAGRQPGAISHQWRNILRMLYMNYPEGFTEYNVVAAAAEEGLTNLRPKDALDRLRAHIGNSYVEFSGNKYHVTDFAAEKYAFTRAKTATEFLGGIGVPSAEAKETP